MEEKKIVEAVDEFEFEGNTYVTKYDPAEIGSPDECRGCICDYRGDGHADCYAFPECDGEVRSDGRSVIWVRK